MIKSPKTYLMSLLMIVTCTQHVLAKEPAIIHETWKPHNIADISGYMNITGDYNLLGEGAPQMPLNFRGRPFSLDAMTSCDIPYDDRKKVTRVHIDQKDCTELIVTFFSKAGVLAKRRISGSDKVKISCTLESFIIKETALKTKGEAVSGTLDVESSYYLTEDGSLILHSKYVGISHSFIFFWRDKEEYLVRFNKVKP